MHPSLFHCLSHRSAAPLLPPAAQPQVEVEHALRQAMTADAHTLQFKLPPPGVPLPPTHTSDVLAEGAPVVECLAVTSLWCMHVLKLLAQVGGGGWGQWAVPGAAVQCCNTLHRLGGFQCQECRGLLVTYVL